MPAWANGKTVVVLGAGATRGAEFVESGPGMCCLPPLNADFFTQLQRIQTKKLQADVDAVVDDVVNSFGPNFHLSLEEYFTHIEALRRSSDILRRSGSKKYSKTRLNAMRKHLLAALSAVLEESADVTAGAGRARRYPCSHHAQLVAALSPPDAIISFNYDCVIDHTLRSDTRSVWSARYGYGFPNPSRIDPSTASTWMAAHAPVNQNDTIRLYKLHGSLNWRKLPSGPADTISFREKLYKQNGQKEYEIVPPEFTKDIQREPLQTLWARATSAVRAAETLAMIGFSFPPTDQLVEAMFRMGLEDNRSLKRLVIVNPSAKDRERIRSVCFDAIQRRKPRVVQFDTLSEFAPFSTALLN